jgi:cell volume regulation protein A
MLYALDMKGYEEHKTLGELIGQMVGGKPVVGDQSEWSGMLWTIAEVEGNSVRKIGVKPVVKKNMPSND